MENNIFGEPIVDGTLEERIDEALRTKNAGGKDVNARNYVENLKAEWGADGGVSTKCMVYNATGDTIEYVLPHDWDGQLGDDASYPLKIENGQWGTFLHGGSNGSKACVVYRAKNAKGLYYDWLLGWCNPLNGHNHAYTEIRKAYSYEHEDHWEDISKNLDQSDLRSSEECDGCSSTVIIGDDNTTIYAADMMLVKPCNVFGTPITRESLSKLPEYENWGYILQTEIARVAANMKYAEKKYEHALSYVKNLKKTWGGGLCTLCLVYNGTGETITLVQKHSWDGDILVGPYPLVIANGQWGAFLHGGVSPHESKACVVYRGSNDDYDYYDWMLGWYNPFDIHKHAYTEIRAPDYFKDGDKWPYVDDKLKNSGPDDSNQFKRCWSSVIIGSELFDPVYEAQLTLTTAFNVYGTPITDEFLRKCPEYANKPNITPIDRAKVALKMKYAKNKADNARTCLEDLTMNWTRETSTLCMVYNATGDTLKYVMTHTWAGVKGYAPYQLLEIANGQWGVFWHRWNNPGTKAAVVYRGKNADGNDTWWTMAWSNLENEKNHVLADIGGGDFSRLLIHTDEFWNAVDSFMNATGLNHSCTAFGGVSTVKITQADYKAMYEAELTLENAGT